MKFKFRFDTIMKQRKVEQDVAQREHAEAAEALRKHMAYLKSLYDAIDSARARMSDVQGVGGKCANELMRIHDFIGGQKVKIQLARETARQLMSNEEEKLEVLAQKMKAHKVLEKLKEKQKAAHRIETAKRASKVLDDLATIRHHLKRMI